MQCLQGHLLVASPHMKDPNFGKSVVLIVQHDENGALGLILNRPSDKTIADIWDQVSPSDCESEALLHVGGPVPGPLMAVHGQSSLSDTEILSGVHFTADVEKLEQLVARNDDGLRIFVGHAGWTSGQLEDELEAGGWMTTPAKQNQVLQSDDDLWDKVTKQIGNSMLFSALGIKHVPKDASMN